MRPSERDALTGFVLRELAAIEARLNEAHENCRNWHATGYPTNSIPQQGAKGSHSDRTGDSAMRPDQFGAIAKEADKQLQLAHDAVQHLVTFVNANTQQRAGIHCGNLHCDRVMNGKDNDRPRGVERECPRCHMHRRRHGQPWPHQSATRLPTVQADAIKSVTLPPQ